PGGRNPVHHAPAVDLIRCARVLGEDVLDHLGDGLTNRGHQRLLRGLARRGPSCGRPTHCSRGPGPRQTRDRPTGNRTGTSRPRQNGAPELDGAPAATIRGSWPVATPRGG